MQIYANEARRKCAADSPSRLSKKTVNRGEESAILPGPKNFRGTRTFTNFHTHAHTHFFLDEGKVKETRQVAKSNQGKRKERKRNTSTIR